jgi:RNA polymerase sigma-70 factor, ECF subfamily
MSIEKDNILELAKQAKLGDQAAFASLYDIFSQRLYAYIRIKISTEAEAEDILQEVFLKAWVGLKNLDVSNLNFSAWIYKITGNTINDYYRKKYRRPNEVSIEEAAELEGSDSPAANASHGLTRDAIKLAMANLPAHFKEVIELRFFQDFSVAETAQIMGQNSVTVRVWQHRALSRLKELFKQSNI